MIRRLTVRGRLSLPPCHCHNVTSNQWNFMRRQPLLSRKFYSTDIVPISQSHDATDLDWIKIDNIFRRFPKLAKIAKYHEKGNEYGSLQGFPELPNLQGIANSKVTLKIDNKILKDETNECHITFALSQTDFSTQIFTTGSSKSLALKKALLKLLLRLDGAQFINHPLLPWHEPLGPASVMTPRKEASSMESLVESLVRPWEQVHASVTTRQSWKSIMDEKHAIVDVYNYTAKYMYIPDYSLEVREIGEKKYYTVKVSLLEHNIHMTAEGSDLHFVQTLVFSAVKKAIEKHHAANKEPPLALPGSVFLSTKTAANFMDFYKDHYYPNLILRSEKWHTGWSSQFNSNSKPLGPPFRQATKNYLRELASLATAILIVKDKPQLLLQYSEKLGALTGLYVAKAAPVNLEIKQSSLNLMQQTIQKAGNSGLPSSAMVDWSMHEKPETLVQNRLQQHLSLDAKEKRSDELLKWYQACVNSKPGVTDELPMTKKAVEVTNIVENNQYSIIIGDTGSGKTTQVPQILLDNYIRSGRGGFCRIICTQPRRIAATSVAERVATERGQRLGDQVGYHIAFDKQIPVRSGSIEYCTTGILLNKLIHDPDSVFESTSHIILDEVHERGIIIDFSLIMLKRAMKERIQAGKVVPKVCFMSATMNAEAFESYFTVTDESRGEIPCPTLYVPGRMFPVAKFYLDDILDTMKNQVAAIDSKALGNYLTSERNFANQDVSHKIESEVDWDVNTRDVKERMSIDHEEAQVPIDLAASVIAHIVTSTKAGAILVFLPGMLEIVLVQRILQTKIHGVDFNDGNRYKIFVLHSSIADAQKEAFKPVPQGCRKIVLATNIAETSVTIPDIQYVIDTGKHRQKSYDSVSQVSSLAYKWISKSSAKQRLGRAGRVQNGNYYALFSKTRFETLRDETLPEILRSDLQSTCLQVRTLGYKGPIGDFLAEAIEPPFPDAIQGSLQSLTNLGALTASETITPLGRLLGSLPVSPALGKMIVLGIIFRCLDPMIILGAISGQSIFHSPLDLRNEAINSRRGFSKRSNSDHIASLNAFQALRTLYHQMPEKKWLLSNFATKKFLNLRVFRRVYESALKIEEALVQNGLIPKVNHPFGESGIQYGGPLLNENSSQVELVKAVLLSGLFPNIGTKIDRQSFYQIPTYGKSLVENHLSSLNHPVNLPSSTEGRKRISSLMPNLMAYSELALTAAGLRMRETTEITPYMVALFGGDLHESHAIPQRIEMDNWLPLTVSAEQGGNTDTVALQTLLKFRNALERMKEHAFRNLGQGNSLADDKICVTFARSLKTLLNLEQDLGRFTERHEHEFIRNFKTNDYWSTPSSSSSPEPAISDESFLNLVEGILEKQDSRSKKFRYTKRLKVANTNI